MTLYQNEALARRGKVGLQLPKLLDCPSVGVLTFSGSENESVKNARGKGDHSDNLARINRSVGANHFWLTGLASLMQREYG